MEIKDLEGSEFVAKEVDADLELEVGLESGS